MNVISPDDVKLFRGVGEIYFIASTPRITRCSIQATKIVVANIFSLNYVNQFRDTYLNHSQ